KLIREKGEQDYLALFKKAKANTKIYACSMASKLFGLKKEDYNELVDDVVGIMSFYNEVEGGQIIDVW
ncbi:MAG: DsrE family protein, partial [Thermoprotei archaeon]